MKHEELPLKYKELAENIEKTVLELLNEKITMMESQEQIRQQLPVCIRLIANHLSTLSELSPERYDSLIEGMKDTFQKNRNNPVVVDALAAYVPLSKIPSITNTEE